MLGLFFAAPVDLLAAQFVGAAVALSVHRRQRPVKLAFNLARACRSAPASRSSSSARFLTTAPRACSLWVVALRRGRRRAHARRRARLRGDRGRRGDVSSAPQLQQTLGVSLVGALATACLGSPAVVLDGDRPLGAAAAGRSRVALRGSPSAATWRSASSASTSSSSTSRCARRRARPSSALRSASCSVAARRLLRAEYAEIHPARAGAGEPVLRSISGSPGEVLMQPDELRAGRPSSRFADAERGRPLAARPRGASRIRSTVSSPPAASPTRSSARSAATTASSGCCSSATALGDVTTFDENDRRALRDVRQPRQRPARERPARAVARAGDRAAGAAAAPGVPRHAHRPPEPRALRRAGRRGARARGDRRNRAPPSSSSISTTSSRQRQLGPRSRRRAARRRSPSASAAPIAAGDIAGPARRRRVRASCSRTRTRPTAERGRPADRRRAAPSRSRCWASETTRPREHRDRASTGPHAAHGRGADPQRRHRHVRGEGRRATAATRSTSRAPQPPARSSAGSRSSCEHARRARRDRRPLPADRLARRRPRSRRSRRSSAGAHPERGLLAPASSSALAEESGLIVDDRPQRARRGACRSRDVAGDGSGRARHRPLGQLSRPAS